jgi:hypothetical protein
MKTTEITNEDLHRVRISYRCGVQSIVELPQEFARLTNVCVWPNCKTLFRIQERDHSREIERMPATVHKQIS